MRRVYIQAGVLLLVRFGSDNWWSFWTWPELLATLKESDRVSVHARPDRRSDYGV